MSKRVGLNYPQASDAVVIVSGTAKGKLEVRALLYTINKNWLTLSHLYVLEPDSSKSIKRLRLGSFRNKFGLT